MIYFNVNIRNPYWWDRFDNLWCKSGNTPWKHKHWEVELLKCEELFRIEFSWTVRQDHAGVGLELGLLGYKIDFRFYDSRHWYEEKGRWIDYSNLDEMRELYPEHYK